MLAVTLLLSLLFSLFAVWVKPKNEKSGVYRMLLEEEGVSRRRFLFRKKVSPTELQDLQLPRRNLIHTKESL